MTTLNLSDVPYKVVLWGSIIIYAIASIYSQGYFHPDEHFQILEFANYKMGRIGANQMPWEFNDMIRPSFQAWIAYGIIKSVTIVIGFYPHLIALILRIVTAAFAIFSVDRFIKANQWQVLPQNLIFFFFCSYFLWFLPIVNVRFSSESWSGIFFLLAAGIVKNRRMEMSDAVKIGVFCGAAFLCRYQTVFLFIGLLSWLCFVKKVDWRLLVIMNVMFMFIMAIGVILDFYFYDQWTLTAWNYFEVNILKDVASNFGVISWWKYSLMVIKNIGYPIATLIICTYISLAVFRHRSMLFWLPLLFIAVHLVIPHKEVRFLFPIVNLLPLVIVLGYQLIDEWAKTENISISRYVFVMVAIVVIGLNFIALAASVVTSPSYGRIAALNFIDRRFAGQDIDLYTIGSQEQNPYVPYTFLHQSFYFNKRINNIFLKDYSTLNEVTFKNVGTSLFIIRGFERGFSNADEKLLKLGFKETYRSTPDWIIKLRGLILQTKAENSGDYIIFEKAAK